MNSLAAWLFFGGPKRIICEVKTYISAVNGTMRGQCASTKSMNVTLHSLKKK